ncbi:MAG TPA: oxygenase MpaB family protein [Noviherbaspirillum sp.]|uniref:oxygenase MpaB family protein n=1 Tax=Noviherbaspirillum sp. TaxID=1926288 RepID=UPI002D2F936A|nr:oxygenase MpaB family protein [Noviherbaspirillum sp.]HYD95229.1 oxygenase MpaB family protein [Noviherbaspirillum sp.]
MQRRLEAAAHAFIQGETGFDADFSTPAGEPALAAPDSISWRVFKNPLSLFVGGVAAVLLELAEPRVREGVWRNTAFRNDPLQRIRRTGLSAMMTVYGPRSRAEAMIARVRALHARVAGTTPAGLPYRADDPELLTWVHATASYGFLEAYCRYVDPLHEVARNRFYAEGASSAKLYGADRFPASQQELDILFVTMGDKLEASTVVFEFLDIVRRVRLLPPPLARVQELLVKAAISILPGWVRERLTLGDAWDLSRWQRRMIARGGALIDRIPLHAAPPAQACRRLGLAEDYLYARRR